MIKMILIMNKMIYLIKIMIVIIFWISSGEHRKK